MTTTSNLAPPPTFMVVATVRHDANLADLAALRADEEKQLAALQSDGKVGAHHVSAARRTVFLEVMAADEKHVGDMLATLPFAKFFDLDIYPIPLPGPIDHPGAQSPDTASV